MRINSFSLGADPELFIVDTSTNKIISSAGIIPGLKDHPYVAEDMPKGFGIEVDNILAEFNIPPCNSMDEWVNNIEYMKDYLRNFVKRINVNYDIKCSAYELVDDDQLQTEQAREFGCDPDYNVYTMKANPKPKGAETNGRSAGFHVHCGYYGQNIQTSIDLIRLFDIYLGIPSLLYDTDNRRRSLYGKAGAFRLCEYGFEYRSLSGAMLASKDLLRFIYNQAAYAISNFNRRGPCIDRATVQTCINEGDVNLAKKLIAKYNLIAEDRYFCNRTLKTKINILDDAGFNPFREQDVLENI